jgi:hypothetical protein
VSATISDDHRASLAANVPFPHGLCKPTDYAELVTMIVANDSSSRLLWARGWRKGGDGADGQGHAVVRLPLIHRQCLRNDRNRPVAGTCPEVKLSGAQGKTGILAPC